MKNRYEKTFKVTCYTKKILVENPGFISGTLQGKQNPRSVFAKLKKDYK